MRAVRGDSIQVFVGVDFAASQNAPTDESAMMLDRIPGYDTAHSRAVGRVEPIT